MKFIKNIIKTISFVYIPLLLILSFFPKTTDGGTSYSLNLLFFFLYSFPFFCAFLEIALTIIGILEKAVRSNAEKIVHTIRLLLSGVIILSLINISRFLSAAIICAVLWIVCKFFEAVLFRRIRRGKGMIVSWRLVLLVVLIIFMVLFAFLIFCIFLENKNGVRLSEMYQGPLSCISHFGNDGAEIALMDMTEDAHKNILSVLNKGKWQDGVTNCGYDYEFKTKNETIRYHSECGTFIDITNNKSLILSEKDRLIINTTLGAAYNSVNEEEYDISLAFTAENKHYLFYSNAV